MLTTSLGGLAVSMVTLAGCSHPQTSAPATLPPDAPASLNRVTVARLVEDLTRAGLSMEGAHDVTQLKCAKLQCIQAIDAQNLSILKFPTTGRGERYEGSISNAYQIEDVVLVFAPALGTDQKAAYERVVTHAIEGAGN